MGALRGSSSTQPQRSSVCETEKLRHELLSFSEVVFESPLTCNKRGDKGVVI